MSTVGLLKKLRMPNRGRDVNAARVKKYTGCRVNIKYIYSVVIERSGIQKLAKKSGKKRRKN